MDFDIHAPRWARELKETQIAILEGITAIMALVQVDQTVLDTLATDLSAAVSAVQTEIQNLEAQAAAGTLPAASLDGLNSALSGLQALEVPAPAPAPNPAPEPTPPTGV